MPVLWPGSGMWYLGILMMLLGLLLFICFFDFSQVGKFNTLQIPPLTTVGWLCKRSNKELCYLILYLVRGANADMSMSLHRRSKHTTDTRRVLLMFNFVPVLYSDTSFGPCLKSSYSCFGVVTSGFLWEHLLRVALRQALWAGRKYTRVVVQMEAGPICKSNAFLFKSHSNLAVSICIMWFVMQHVTESIRSFLKWGTVLNTVN